jgi:hypothetical protein
LLLLLLSAGYIPRDAPLPPDPSLATVVKAGKGNTLLHYAALGPPNVADLYKTGRWMLVEGTGCKGSCAALAARLHPLCPTPSCIYLRPLPAVRTHLLHNPELFQLRQSGSSNSGGSGTPSHRSGSSSSGFVDSATGTESPKVPAPLQAAASIRGGAGGAATPMAGTAATPVVLAPPGAALARQTSTTGRSMSGLEYLKSLVRLQVWAAAGKGCAT